MSTKKSMLTPYDLDLINRLIEKEIWAHNELNIVPNEEYLKYLDGMKLRTKNTLKVMRSFINHVRV